MSSNALDNLAINGVINFDADSYVKGQPPRYVGNPNGYNGLPLDQPLMAAPQAYGVNPGTQLSGQPSKDAFINHGENEHSRPSWKALLTGVALAGLAIFTGVKCKAKLSQLFSKKTVVAKAKSAITNAATNATTPKTAKKPSKLKAIGISLASLLGLYGVYKFVSKHQHHQQ